MEATTDNLLQKGRNDIFEIIDSAISIAASRWPEDFVARRNQIARKLCDTALLLGASHGSNSTDCNFGSSSTCNIAAREADKNEVLATDNNKKKGRHVIRIKLPANLRKPKIQSDNFFPALAVQENPLCHKIDGVEGAGKIVQEDNFVQAKLADEEELLQKKLEDSKRKLQERYKKIQGSRKRILVVELADAPKPPVDPKKPRIHYAR